MLQGSCIVKDRVREPPSRRPCVYVILVNWNGWQHTLACLESLFRQDYPSWRVVVCDNASTDGSLENIQAWANGLLHCDVAAFFPLNSHVSPPVPKPISYVYYEKEEAEGGGGLEPPHAPLVLIQVGENVGYAGGNNVALRYMRRRGDYDYVWILNNDTIVRPDTLAILVDKLRSAPAFGMCGATVAYQHDPNLIQTRGGSTYLPWLGQTRHIGALERLVATTREPDIEARMACVSGACMLVTKRLLKDVGLLSEIYFLYFEELDWALRARRYGYALAYASQAIIYHKEGGSIGGGNRDRGNKSWLADYYEVRNRLVVTRKFYPWALPVVCLSLIGTIINRIRRRQWKRLGMVFKCAVDAFKVTLDTARAAPPKEEQGDGQRPDR
jgi:GT2 family glycosyltransferase